MGNTGSRNDTRSGFKGRKYLSPSERRRVMAEAGFLVEDQRLLIETLIWTGARISEVLMLTPLAFDLPGSILTLPTLKRRKAVTRDVPLPPDLTARLERHFTLTDAQRNATLQNKPLWPISRTTAWRIVKDVMCRAGIAGIRATPRGLRHAFGIASVQSGVPVTLLKRWMGHSRLSTTEIYLDVIGEEELGFARRFWSESAPGAGLPIWSSSVWSQRGKRVAMQVSSFAATSGKVFSLFAIRVRHPAVVALLILILVLIAAVTGTDLFQKGIAAFESAVTSSQRIESALAEQKARLEEANRRTAESLAAAKAANAELQRRLAEQESARAEAAARARESELRRQQAEADKAALIRKGEHDRLAQQRVIEEEGQRLDAERRLREVRRNAFCQQCCQTNATRGNSYDPNKAIPICLDECRSGRPSNWFGQGAVLCRATAG